MVQSEPIHLGHITMEYLGHQGHARVIVLSSGPYITQLTIGMGLLDAIRGAEKMIVPSPFGLETIRLMNMIRRYRDGVYVMIMPSPEIFKVETDAAEGSQPAQEPQPGHLEINAPPIVQELPTL